MLLKECKMQRQEPPMVNRRFLAYSLELRRSLPQTRCPDKNGAIGAIMLNRKDTSMMPIGWPKNLDLGKRLREEALSKGQEDIKAVFRSQFSSMLCGF
jgi:hypothetical protein